MPRVLVLVVLLLLGFAGSTHAVVGNEAGCATACTDEDPKSPCGTDCDDCACCARHLTPILTASTVLPEAPLLVRSPDVEGPIPSAPSVDPRKIRHVPRSAFG